MLSPVTRIEYRRHGGVPFVRIKNGVQQENAFGVAKAISLLERRKIQYFSEKRIFLSCDWYASTSTVLNAGREE